MKKFIMIMAIATGCLASTGCKDKEEKERVDKKNEIAVDNVPAPVISAFSAKYPGATEIVWETAHEGDKETYKVKFKKDDKYMKAEFGTDGSFVKESDDD